MGYPIGYMVAIQDICYVVDMLTKGEPIWGLIWSTVTKVVWTIWHKRNIRWHRNESRLVTNIADKIISGIKLMYREAKYKRAHQQGSKARCMVT